MDGSSSRQNSSLLLQALLNQDPDLFNQQNDQLELDDLLGMYECMSPYKLYTGHDLVKTLSNTLQLIKQIVFLPLYVLTENSSVLLDYPLTAVGLTIS